MNPQQVDHHTPPAQGLNRDTFLSQDCVKAETSDSRLLFLDPNWLSKNYFE